MSNTPEFELDLDLHFLPAWAQQSPNVNRYAKFEGEPDRGPRRGGDRFEQRGPRGPGGPRPDRPRRPDGDRGQRGPGGPHRDGGGGPSRFGGPDRREERREPAPQLPEVDVTFLPEDKGVESLARQIKLTGRAYPLFEIGQMILKKADRFHLEFKTLKKADGQVAQKLFVCNLDETVWLSEADAVAHVLRKHFETFYQSEKTATEAPKGTYTFVGQCGISGVVLGPPNYHDYQNKLRKLHADRFARMPFETFKARIKIVRDEAVVKQWLEEQSWTTEYICLNLPEPKKLATRPEVEAHFREVHLANIIRPVDSVAVTSPAARAALPGPLQTLARLALEDQTRFPLKIATLLSQLFARHGLQFFKVNKTVTHVAVARPHFLDMAATPVSDGVRRIVEFIDATPSCTRRRLLEALVPSPAAPIAPKPAPDAPATPAAEAPAPTPEQAALISDLHWLIHQGHVIEFANGRMETAKRALPKPPAKVAPKPAPAPKPVTAVVETAPAVIAETATPPAASSDPVPTEAVAPAVTTPPVDSANAPAV